MIKELCVVGHPSFCGGADTELLDAIKCWYKMGIKIYICHTGPLISGLKSLELESKYNVTYLNSRQWYEIKGMHTISFCNGDFLANLRHIKKFAKTTTFVNCMTFNFQKEIQCQHEGLIDFHLYQTKHGFEKISKNLSHLGTYRPLMIHPYFDPEQFPFYQTRPDDHFRFGRISRSDLSKYHGDQMVIYDSIISSKPKSGVILGWDFRMRNKLSIPVSDITVTTNDKGIKTEIYKNYIQLFKEGGTTQKKFYDFCDTMIMSSDTFENLPRVGLECMSSGSVLVVDNRGGWTIEVEDGKTGYLCNNTQEFIEKSTLLANNKELRDQIRGLAREKLIKEWGIEQAMKSWELVFNEWEKFN